MTLMARGRLRGFYGPGTRDQHEPLTWGFMVERVTGIELALSAWESDRSEPLTALTWAADTPLVTVIGPATPGLMARQWPVADGSGGSWPSIHNFVSYVVPGSTGVFLFLWDLVAGHERFRRYKAGLDLR